MNKSVSAKSRYPVLPPQNSPFLRIVFKIVINFYHAEVILNRTPQVWLSLKGTRCDMRKLHILKKSSLEANKTSELKNNYSYFMCIFWTLTINITNLCRGMV